MTKRFTFAGIALCVLAGANGPASSAARGFDREVHDGKLVVNKRQAPLQSGASAARAGPPLASLF